MKLLLDEQISDQVAERLRVRGHDALAVVSDPGLRGQPDFEVFRLAQEQGRAVVTYDRGDFEAVVRRYLAWERDHRGLVLVHRATIPPQDLGRLAAALAGFLEGPPLGPSFVVWLRPPG